MKIAELLHFCLTAKRSGEIIVNEDHSHGTIYIRNGEVIAAEYQDLMGEDAFFALMSLESANSKFAEKEITETETITRSTHYLLMEAARISDVSAEKTIPEKAQPSRSSQNYCLHFITMDNAKFALLGDTIRIGRENDCDITVPDVSVSARHCQIFWNGSHHILSDMGSSNGTYVNDVPIQEAHTLQPGDDIQIGLCHFLYKTVVDGDNLQDPKTVIPFTFGSQTQKIELPVKDKPNSAVSSPQQSFKEFKPLEQDKKKIHIWPFGKESKD